MKKRTIATLMALMLLAGCETQAPAAPSATDTPDMEAIIQQSVNEAVQEKIKEYEEEQKKKDEEITRLKDQIEDLTSQSEVPLEEADAESSAPESQPESSSSQAEVPSQPKPESTAPTQQVKPSTLNEGTVFEGCQVTVNDWTTPAVSSGGRDWPISTWYFWGPGEVVLGSISGDSMDKISRKYAASTNYDPDIDWSIWYADAFNEYRNIVGSRSDSLEEPIRENPKENENPQPAGVLSEENALEVIRLTNEEREKNGLPALEMDSDLMELAQIRAEEVSTKYSHERPDGSHVVQMGYGENVGAKASAEKQVTSWMGSDGHRTNILREHYTKIGVGCYQTDNGKHYWVQIFSR